MNVIPECSGTGLELKKGQKLKITDIEGQQVSDFFCFFKDDQEDYLSSGRTFDYNSKIHVTTGDKLYSSKSKVMAVILEDKVGKHDFVLTPCSKDTFIKLYHDHDTTKIGCEGNLLKAFDKFGIKHKALPPTFNIFMNVRFDSEGKVHVDPPRSKSGDYIVIKAEEDLIVGITACSAPKSNNGKLTTIGYEVI